MLKLESIDKQRTFVYEESDYIPLRIEFQPSILSLDEIYYWRSTDRNSLLEIKIYASSGMLAEVNLVLIPEARIIRKDLLPDLDGINTDKGLPCVNLKL